MICLLAHGTFIGSLRLEGHKPTQLQINSTFHFGASTRYYTLRERPSVCSRNTNIMEDIPMNESSDGALLGLPESQTELDNLTEYNTAHNRRISMLGIADDNLRKNQKGKKKRRGVTFNEEEIIINPEDVDPSIGRFRNLIHTTVIPTKKMKLNENSMGISTATTSNTFNDAKHLHPSSLLPHLYQGLPPIAENMKPGGTSDGETSHSNLVSKLGLLLPNPAPDVLPTDDIIRNVNKVPFEPPVMAMTGPGMLEEQSEDDLRPKKKKYAKEAWPGRKPLLSGF